MRKPNPRLQRPAIRRLAAAEAQSLAIQIRVVVFATVTFGALSFASGAASSPACPCPASISAEAGSEALAVVRNRMHDPVLVACGYRDSKADVYPVVASEFQVFRCGSGRSLLSFNANETCTLEIVKNHLVVTRVEKWPFGPAWRWIKVPVRTYITDGQSPDRVVTRTVLKLPSLTKRQIGDALDYYARHINQTSFEDDYEDVVGRLLAAALTGSAAARQALLEMPTVLSLDGASAEIYQDAVALYNAAETPSQRLPGLGNQ